MQKNVYFIYSVISLLFLSAFAGNAEAQTLRGFITDAVSGEPLIGAAVKLKDSDKGAVTDEKGFFSFSVSKEGTYELKISFVGYRTLSAKASTEKEVRFNLKESPLLTESVEIVGIKDAPMTYTKVTETDLEELNLGQDIPILLNFTPSVVSTSDAGAGIGYTGIRVRGSDATRTNVTINGIPLNDAESQGVFWVNMPDFSSSVSEIVIQRGVGTSVNGAAAFGASLNISSQEPSDLASVETNHSVGSFNTLKHNVELNTGRIGKYWKSNLRLSKITSDGFIDEASADLRSFYFSTQFEKEKSKLTFNAFSGKEITFQAWYGVPESALEEGNRTLNIVGGYDNEVDNYQQDHYQLLFDQGIGEKWTLNTGLHYTRGRGYFEQFRAGDDFGTYGLDPIVIGDSTISSGDFIRRRWLDNHFYGAVASMNYDGELEGRKLSASFGGGWNRYEGKHFGELIWAQFASGSGIRDRYYDNDATKTDFNLYGKIQHELFDSFSAYLDLQVRTVNYDFLGFDNEGRNVQQNDALTFFNPKFGLRYEQEKYELYASYARGNKEPNRNDYTESTPGSRPEHETLDNVEVGGSLFGERFNISANYYLMLYKNQLVLTGQVNDVGAYTRTNIEDSYRTGVELSGVWQATDKLLWQGNVTLSQNRIPEFTAFLDNFDEGGQQETKYTDTDLAFSPNFIAASELEYTLFKGLTATLRSKYVGEQFLDNTSTDSRKLDAFFVNDFQLNYEFTAGLFKNIRLSLLVNNILEEEYESNGYTFGYIAGGAEIHENYYYPQAGRNFLASIGLRF